MTIRHFLRHRLFETDDPIGRRFGLCIQCLILLAVVEFSLETLPGLSPASRRWLTYVEAGTIAIFTVEYLLRLYAAERPLRFFFSFFGLVDLLAVLPFYVATGLDLRGVRIFRLLRLFRILKFIRYTAAANRFVLAIRIAKEELVLFSMVALMVLYVAAMGIYLFEHEAQPDKFRSIFDALWWAVATLTTVGYGDVYPITDGGRLFTFVVLMVGLGIVAVPTGLVASALAEARRIEQPGQQNDSPD
ncbi:MAG: ion transporter [Gammaproteobacteria bacterium]|nr:ion transporter [Gammaproteobacteria bacterium]